MSEKSILERRLAREKAARKEAEFLLENKSLELYHSNHQLELALKHLKKQTMQDLRKFELEECVDVILIEFGHAFLKRNLDAVFLNDLLDRLKSSDVIVAAGLRLSPQTLVNLQSQGVEPHLEDIRLGEKQLFIDYQCKSIVDWQEERLYLPLEIGGGLMGTLAFETSVGELDYKFIEGQMALIAELLCSAIVHQNMISATVEARTRAEQSEKATKEFVAMINHEMRTPLNGLLGSAELLQDTSLTQEQLSYLGNLRQSGDLLRVIINDLLDYSKMSAGMMELIQTQFKWESLESTLNGIFVPQAAEKQIQFTMVRRNPLPTHFIGDSERITQVLVNVIGNAVKFTESGSVSVSYEWRESELSVVVEDTGIGIPAADHDCLFDPFIQSDRSSTRFFEGSGLGLAICKQLLELMSGRVSFQSTVGKGTQFTLLLPLSVPERRDQETSPSHDQPSDRLSVNELAILVVDDIRMNQIIINSMLSKMDFSPDIFGNGVEALSAVQTRKYDLIFMDCRMPEMDGFEATERLRKLGCQAPIIALTAATTLAERERCFKCGMNDILSKPYTGQELKSMINKWS